MNIIKHLSRETLKDITGSEVFCTKKGEVKSGYIRIVTEIFEKSEKKEIELSGLKYWARNSGHYTLIDRDYERALEVLKALDIPFEEANTAPRGGVEGDTLIIRYDGRNKNVKAIRSLLKAIRNNEI